MKKRQFLFSISLLFAFQIHAQRILHNELLGRPTDNSITIQAFFADSAEVRVQYGTVSGTYPNQTSWQTVADSMPATILVSGLLPDTKYYYTLQYRLQGTSGTSTRGEHSFHTQRPVGSSYTFVVQADPHMDANSDSALYRLCLKNQLDDNPDFMVDLGDFLMTDKLANAARVVTRDTIVYRCHLLRSFYETECHSVPLFIANGNHEGETGWYQNGTANNMAVWNTLERKKYFPNPDPNSFYEGDTTNYPFVGLRESYYAWQWGDAQFIVLDPFWFVNPKPDSLTCWRWTLGKKQYDWLKTTLENSHAKYKFVFHHQMVGGDASGRGGTEFANLYEWGGNNLDGTPGWATNRPGWYKPIKDLLTENRVTIFFHGHDHFFDKQEKDCLIYQETPQPSLANFNNNSATAYGYLSGEILNNSGHLRVNVSPAGIRVDYVRVYLPQSETATRHNKDISATYFIGSTNCYDSISTGTPVLWNSEYSDELVYPNPFMKQTTIEFSVKRTEQIVLSIYNESGQLVKTLIGGNEVPQGKYQVMWDGKNSEGAELANGIYQYELSGAQSGRHSGKIVLTR